jgi:hypothetical protein
MKKLKEARRKLKRKRVRKEPVNIIQRIKDFYAERKTMQKIRDAAEFKEKREKAEFDYHMQKSQEALEKVKREKGLQ